MMKKNLILLICMVVISVCLWACGDKPEEDDTTKGTSSSGETQSTINVSNELLELDYNHGCNVYVWFAGYNNMIYSCSNTLTKDAYIMYVADLESGVQVPLCNNPNCKHNSEKCNGYICGNMNFIHGVELANNNIYVVISSHTDKSMSLVRLSLDGTSRDTVENIVQYKSDDISVAWSGGDVVQIADDYVYVMINMKVTESSDRTDVNGEIIEGIQDVVVEDKIKIYRYKIDGTEEPEIVLDEEINREVGYYPEYNVLDGYLYYCSRNVNKRINLNTMETETITEDMYYASRYNNDGKILACEGVDGGVDIYVYDQESKTKHNISDSGLDENNIEIITQLEFGIIECYIDDKYIYIYEPGQAEGTYIFDHQFKYVGFTELAVYATVGDNLLCSKSKDLIAINRDDIIKKEAEMYTLVKGKAFGNPEWLTYIGN